MKTIINAKKAAAAVAAARAAEAPADAVLWCARCFCKIAAKHVVECRCPLCGGRCYLSF